MIQSSCILMKRTIKVEVKTDEEITKYVLDNELQFDFVIRPSDNSTINRIPEYCMNGVQFVNIYDSIGNLLKISEGVNCEIDAMNFLKDSISFKSLEDTKYYKCNFNDFLSSQRVINKREEFHRDKFDHSYKIVIGWATAYNQFSLMRKRTEIVTKMIPEFKKNNKNILVIGLNLDPM